MPGDEEWRLLVKLDAHGPRQMLDNVVGLVRGKSTRTELEAAVSDDVVITHDGQLLFAYAASNDAITTARHAIENALRRDRITATVSTEHWDQELDDWRPDDRPPRSERAPAGKAPPGVSDVETRTMVVWAGKAVPADVEATMRDWAEKLDLRCEIVEHPHLLTTQIVFSVTGPRPKVNEFVSGLKAVEGTTWRYGHALRGVSFS